LQGAFDVPLYKQAPLFLMIFLWACQPFTGRDATNSSAPPIGQDAPSSNRSEGLRLDGGHIMQSETGQADIPSQQTERWCEQLHKCCERFPPSMIDDCRLALAEQNQNACQDLLQSAVGEVLCAEQTEDAKPDDSGLGVNSDGGTARVDRPDVARFDSGELRPNLDAGYLNLDARPNPDSGYFNFDAQISFDSGRARLDGGFTDGSSQRTQDAAIMNSICQVLFDCCPYVPFGPPRVICYHVAGRDRPRECHQELYRARSAGRCHRDAGP
jgi:hypothetical protein